VVEKSGLIGCGRYEDGINECDGWDGFWVEDRCGVLVHLRLLFRYNM
jgi:hypothetical protein